MDCKICEQKKPKNQFYWNKKTGYRVSPKCKSCYMKTKSKTLEQKEKHAEYMRNYKYKPSEDKSRITDKKCSLCSNKLPINKFYWSNEKHAYQSQCKQCIRESVDLEKKREYRRKRMLNPKFRIRQNLGTRISIAVSLNCSKKSANTAKLLGCDMDLFYKWLKYQFVKGMTMNNYGKVWHIDHCIPCKEFDLSNKIEQLECFNWTNLRPCLIIDNLTKGSRMDANTILMQEIRVHGFKKIHDIV